MKTLLLIFGWVFLLIGILGIFIPLLPTTPFLLLSAFCFARSSERLYDWLLKHPQLGPPLRDWERGRVIRRGPKLLATLMILGSAAFMVLFAKPPLWAEVTAGVLFSAVLLFIWTREEG